MKVDKTNVGPKPTVSDISVGQCFADKHGCVMVLLDEKDGDHFMAAALECGTIVRLTGKTEAVPVNAKVVIE